MSAAKIRLAATLGMVLLAASAEAGTITGTTGPFRVGGKEVQLQPGAAVPVAKGDRIETLAATVTYRSDTGDTITLERETVAIEQETTQYGAGLFVVKGSATGALSDKTQLGIATGWVSAPAGAHTRVLVEPAPDFEATEAFVRTIEGTSWVRYGADLFAVALPQAHSVVLNIDAASASSLCIRTGQQNAGDVEVHKKVGGGEIVATLPKATSGCFTDVPGENKTKLCNDINSLKTAKIRLTTRFPGRSPNSAAIGPGTCAQIDNATGVIEVLFTAIKFEILERAISLTSEFGTLAQSNFSDVK